MDQQPETLGGCLLYALVIGGFTVLAALFGYWLMMTRLLAAPWQ